MDRKNDEGESSMADIPEAIDHITECSRYSVLEGLSAEPVRVAFPHTQHFVPADPVAFRG